MQESSERRRDQAYPDPASRSNTRLNWHPRRRVHGCRISESENMAANPRLASPISSGPSQSNATIQERADLGCPPSDKTRGPFEYLQRAKLLLLLVILVRGH